ncbi:Membrane Protein Functionally coupled to the MukBEF Chromosome Partitioning Mechanism [Klebsiella pneumoniae IS39]|nr:Membrane Protein Functionally coupled to the MukBEF Chromosome Partitioning Mechanism [Klebsiella pneumoniae IS39]
MPLPALLLLIGIGIALLWFSRFQRTGKLCVSLGWLLLTLLSLQPVADSLLKPIEDTYPTWRGEQPVNYVVVLGGGYTWNPEWAPSSNLINNSLPRLTEGIRLWQANPGSKMIFTGAAAKTNPVSTAEAGRECGEPWRTSQRYHCARSAERYRRGSAGGEARHRRRALPAGHLGVTPSAGDDILSPCRPGSASRAGQSAGGDLAAQSVGAGHSFSSVADAQRPGRL